MSTSCTARRIGGKQNNFDGAFKAALKATNMVQELHAQIDAFPEQCHFGVRKRYVEVFLLFAECYKDYGGSENRKMGVDVYNQVLEYIDGNF